MGYAQLMLVPSMFAMVADESSDSNGTAATVSMANTATAARKNLVLLDFRLIVIRLFYLLLHSGRITRG
mgnify:CR=1 FL=1